ncbi:polysaccharide deacetylase family protein [Maridesulfovibrio hydrothermalis]|nr:polysaccharide deacetylase [Maridesulfovibrio hydrothermalis]
MKFTFITVISSLLVLFISSFTLLPVAQAELVKRKVLVFFNSGEGQSVRENHFMEGFAMPLNYLGFLYDVRDVVGFSYPDEKQMEPYGAIFIGFAADTMPEPNRFLKWLISQQENGRKIIVAGSLGAYLDLNDENSDESLVKEFYSNMGFSWQGNATLDSMHLKYVHVDKNFMNFERHLPVFPPQYAQIVPVGEDIKTWVSVEEKRRPGSQAALVATGPQGGIATTGYIRWQAPVNYLKKWYINPFEFLRQSLGIEGLPALTPTTLNGLRVAFAHIDGDGFVGYTEIDKHKNCGEIIMERIFARYDFPNSASVIAGEINPDVQGSIDNVELARTLFDMKNIETSSHSYTHPYAWNAKLRNSAKYAEDFVIGQYEKPGYKFDATYEIVGSCDYISENLAPPEKPCFVLFWSGMCDPTEKQVAIAEKAGILNLNGGDSVMDARRDSYFGVSPLYRELGKFNQVYTGQANENILTNLWTGPFFGFRNIIETMKRTGSPRRIMPIDIYYHFYSGEKFSSLKALEDVYEWTLSQDIARVYASSYIKMMRGYLTGKIEKLGADHFAVTDYNDCLTVRLDGMDKVPDLGRSKNVLGYDEQPEGIFVHLNPGQSRAELVLTADKNVNAGYLYIKSGTGWVKDFKRTGRGARFFFECFSKGKIELAGLAPGQAYKVISQSTQSAQIRSNDKGELIVKDITSGPLEISRI